MQRLRLVTDEEPYFNPGTPQPVKKKRASFRKTILWAVRKILFRILYRMWSLFRGILSPDIVFQVYGTESDMRHYWSKRTERHLRKVFPIGMIRFHGKWGLIGATLVKAEELDRDCRKSLELLDWTLKEFPRAKVVALAGRLPGFVARAGGQLNPPFVEGSRGTRFAMLSAVRAAAERLPNGKATRIAVLGGGGYTGRHVVSDLAKEFPYVVSLDLRFSKVYVRKNVLYTNRPESLRGVQIVLVLTANGDDVEDLVPYLSNVVVIDDTHPPMHRPIREKMAAVGADVWKATVADGSLRMIPRLPNFRSDDVPGCMLEAIVTLEKGSEALVSQEAFNHAAEETGFRARLKRHTGDS